MDDNIVIDTALLQLDSPVQFQLMNTVLNEMERTLNGDLKQAACDTAKYAVNLGYVSGPLWDEIGALVMEHLFMSRRVHPQRQRAKRMSASIEQAVEYQEPMLEYVVEEVANSPADTMVEQVLSLVSAAKLIGLKPGQSRRRPGAFLDPQNDLLCSWQRLNNRIIQLGDMTKSDCEYVARIHKKLAGSNEFEHRYFRIIGAGLLKTQIVREKYSAEDLHKIRVQINLEMKKEQEV